jgi:DNA-binding response OmpR family regulator
MIIRILLVDDESDITTSLKMGLEDNGFEVDTFNNPILALMNFKAGSYELVYSFILECRRSMVLNYVRK